MEDTEKSDGAPALSLVQSRSRESRRNTSCACCSLRDVETGPPDPQRLGCKSRRMSPRRSRTQIPLYLFASLITVEHSQATYSLSFYLNIFDILSNQRSSVNRIQNLTTVSQQDRLPRASVIFTNNTQIFCPPSYLLFRCFDVESSVFPVLFAFFVDMSIISCPAALRRRRDLPNFLPRTEI